MKLGTFLTGLILLATLSLAMPQPALAQSCQEIDLNGNGIIDTGDYSRLVADFFQSNSPADFNNDQLVDLTDYQTLVESFGSNCSSTSTPAPTSTPTPTSAPIPGAIELNPGDSIQSAVNSHSSGTTFHLNPGVYRQQKIRPKQGQSFIGERGTIISGAKLLNNPSSGSGLWYFANQTEEASPHGNCLSSHPRCNHEHELFLNNQRLRHVPSRSQVTSGTWHFDYGANRVYLRDDPRGQTVELSTTDMAFEVTNSDVAIKNLVVEKYANRAQTGALECKATNCLVEFVEIRNNHGVGLKIGGRNAIARNNFIHHNGQLGYGGVIFRVNGQRSTAAQNVLFERNEISFNNVAGFSPGWEGGGGKLAWVNGFTYRQNYAHHNVGAGIWSDIDNINILYDGNVSVYNSSHGIQHEISLEAEMRNNFAAYNGDYVDNSGVNHRFEHASQIYVQASQDVSVHNNTVITADGPGNGLRVHSEDRGYSILYPGTPWTAVDNEVYNNRIYARDSWVVIAGLSSSSSSSPFDWDSIKNRNSFHDNDYYLVNPSTNNFFYWGRRMTYNEFLSTGQGRGSRLLRATSYPSIPAWNYPVGPQ